MKTKISTKKAAAKKYLKDAPKSHLFKIYNKETKESKYTDIIRGESLVEVFYDIKNNGKYENNKVIITFELNKGAD